MADVRTLRTMILTVQVGLVMITPARADGSSSCVRLRHEFSVAEEQQAFECFIDRNTERLARVKGPLQNCRIVSDMPAAHGVPVIAAYGRAIQYLRAACEADAVTQHHLARGHLSVSGVLAPPSGGIRAERVSRIE